MKKNLLNTEETLAFLDLFGQWHKLFTESNGTSDMFAGQTGLNDSTYYNWVRSLKAPAQASAVSLRAAIMAVKALNFNPAEIWDAERLPKAVEHMARYHVEMAPEAIAKNAEAIPHPDTVKLARLQRVLNGILEADTQLDDLESRLNKLDLELLSYSLQYFQRLEDVSCDHQSARSHHQACSIAAGRALELRHQLRVLHSTRAAIWKAEAEMALELGALSESELRQHREFENVAPLLMQSVDAFRPEAQRQKRLLKARFMEFHYRKGVTPPPVEEY